MAWLILLLCSALTHKILKGSQQKKHKGWTAQHQRSFCSEIKRNWNTKGEGSSVKGNSKTTFLLNNIVHFQLMKAEQSVLYLQIIFMWWWWKNLLIILSRKWGKLFAHRENCNCQHLSFCSRPHLICYAQMLLLMPDLLIGWSIQSNIFQSLIIH